MIAEKEKTTVGAPAARKPVKCPQKVGINLNMHERRTGKVLTLVLGLAFIAVLAGAAAKFGVLDQYRRLADAQGEYARVHQQYEAVQAKLADYDAVLAEYRTYSRDWMTDGGKDSYTLVDRQAVLDLVEREMMPRGTLTALQVQGDEMRVSMSGMTLDRISEMFDALEASSIVKSVELNIAETEKDRAGLPMSFTLFLVLQGEVAE